MTHGRRSSYNTHRCRCPACRRANTIYLQQWRADRRRGHARLGSVVRPSEAVAQLKALAREGVTKGAIARALGLRHRTPRVHPDGITLRHALKIRRLYRHLVYGRD